jgi:uncharacterized membrane protein SpoIIM required for sporulation
MKEVQFSARRAAVWAAWDEWLSSRRVRGATAEGDAPPLAARSLAAPPLADLPLADLPSEFRALCHDLSLARDREYSMPLQDALHRRVLQAHQRIYGAQAKQGSAWLTFLLAAFPALVRREWKTVAAAACLFFVPFLGAIALAQRVPESVYLVLAPEQVGAVEAMYAPTAEHLGRPATATTEWAMWAFYVANNVRIDFQCFAGGLVFGLGSAFFLVYNGLVLGAMAGHVTRIGFIETFWGFVAGHSALELVGVALSGAAGLVLGMSLVSPGPRSRAAALRTRGAVAARLLAGAAVMTFLAAFIEAFWSPNRAVPVVVKYGVGVAFWGLLAAYFAFAGRSHRAA